MVVFVFITTCSFELWFCSSAILAANYFRNDFRNIALSPRTLIFSHNRSPLKKASILKQLLELFVCHSSEYKTSEHSSETFYTPKRVRRKTFVACFKMLALFKAILISVPHKDCFPFQVSNAQLEALRLENRHLRDSSVEDHLSTTAVSFRYHPVF